MLCSTVQARVVNLIISRLRKRVYKAGERVVEEGSPLTMMGFVCEGYAPRGTREKRAQKAICCARENVSP